MQVADELLGAVQGLHDEPQLFTSALLTQVMPHTWNPVLHVKPHVAPSQVAVALPGGAHAEQDTPQELTLLSATHAPPQRW